MTPGTNRPITSKSIVVAPANQVSSDLAGELIILSMETAQYYGLGPVGTRIWELMREPIQVARIQDAIEQEYEVGRDQCEADVLKLLHQLAAEGLIEVRAEDGGS